MAENNFQETVASLFKGMDSFISAKTVVGDAVTVKDTIILPLVDVSFGVGAGAFAGDRVSVRCRLPAAHARPAGKRACLVRMRHAGAYLP